MVEGRNGKSLGMKLKADFDTVLNESTQSMWIVIVIKDCNIEVTTVKCAKRGYSSFAFIA